MRLREFTPDPYPIFLIMAAWHTAMNAFENTKMDHFLETASHIERMWRLEVDSFCRTVNLWIRSQ